MTRVPTFLVIGVQKAATSWLWYCLKDHPEIFLPKKRERHYLGGEEYRKRGWNWWVGRFAEAQSEQVIGDVSVDYLFSSAAPELIKRQLGSPRFIVSLREPIDRAISAYFWNVRRGKIPYLDLNTGLRHALDCVDGTTGTEDTIYADIVRRGFYDEQIARYLQYFEMDRFLFLSFARIRTDPLGELNHAYRFIGLDEGFVPDSLTRQPKRNTYLKWLIQLERVGHISRPIAFALDRINAAIGELGLANRRPELDPALRRELAKVYAKHNRALSEALASVPFRAGGSHDVVAEIDSWTKQMANSPNDVQSTHDS